ncbi:unnamed protein product [Blepharisma stoltei]|uniref:Uncharacterized protein n=1 Tax=Blepharisma stoltei TaxID=1481888 RepID=A0AAU9K4Q3_9CILI|nr:unnamed protein product [Blepharisma stoltei]
MKLTVLELKIWNKDHRIFWAVFAGLQLVIIACILFSLITDSWVELDLSKNQGNDFNSFKGAILRLTEYDGQDTDSSYQDKEDYYCKFNQSGIANPYKAWCDMFHHLNGSGSTFILFDILSIAALVAWAIVLIAFAYSVNCFFCSFVCSTCSCIGHYIAFFVWLINAKGVYDGDCNEIAQHYNNGHSTRSLESPNLCMRNGPGMATFLLIFIPIVVIAFFPFGIVAYRNKRRKDREGEHGEFELQIPPILPNQGEQIPGLFPSYTQANQPEASFGPLPQILIPNEIRIADLSRPPAQSDYSNYPNLQKNIQ